MSTTFELEMQNFVHNFFRYSNKKIVLYGIGRRTATLIEQNVFFNFVGLMDRDSNNIGRILYGLPVISLSQAEEIADMIIINAPETYWKIIYKRILNCKIPVYFTNGKLAYLEDEISDTNNPYWKKNQTEFENILKKYEVISFDMFDTLVSRKVLRPEDVFEIVEKKINDVKITDFFVDFVSIRNKAVNRISNYYTIDDIYEEIQFFTGWEESLINKIKEIELEVEKSLIIPRKEIINICNKMIDLGKDVYIISDMYYSSHTLAELLEQCGLTVDEKKIFVSCEQKASKKEGGLWKTYKENIVGEKKAIHVGDNLRADIEQPSMEGIDTYYLMSIEDMLRISSIRDLYEMVNNVNESIVVGEVVTKIFNNPFQLCESKGKNCFSSRKTWGYCVWGPVIFSFFQWLIKQSFENGIDQLVFFARDGYLIQKDYNFFCKLMEERKAPPSTYLYISRRVAYITAIRNKEDFTEWMEFPYIGKYKDFLEDRFNIKVAGSDKYAENEIQMPNDKNKVWKWILPYIDKIKDVIKKEQNNYLHFLKQMEWGDKFAVVDIGYHGNIQRKLGEILEKELIGFYFYSDLSPDNECCKSGKMIPCFQDKTDLKADNTLLFRYPQLLESLFTAPYGMVKAIGDGEEIICSGAGKNQKYFSERLEINEGIKSFFKSIAELTNIMDVRSFCGEEKFIDRIFGILLENSTITSEISDIFYWDDAIVQRRENGIFF